MVNKQATQKDKKKKNDWSKQGSIIQLVKKGNSNMIQHGQILKMDVALSESASRPETNTAWLHWNEGPNS